MKHRWEVRKATLSGEPAGQQRLRGMLPAAAHAAPAVGPRENVLALARRLSGGFGKGLARLPPGVDTGGGWNCMPATMIYVVIMSLARRSAVINTHLSQEVVVSL